MRAKITVIGSANVDFVMPLPRLPSRGESINGGPFMQSFGGKGSNQAIAAQRAGGDMTAVHCLGDDQYSDKLLAIHRSEHIDTSHIRQIKNARSGTGIIMVDAAGDNLIGTDLGANSLLSPEQIIEAEPALAASRLVLLQMETEDESLACAIQVATKHHVPVMLNYAPFRESTLQLDNRIAILAVNETEASGLSGTNVDSPESACYAATNLAANGHRLVIITLGENGCVVLEDGESSHYPAIPVNAVDATGAGDAFCGAFAVAVAEGKNTRDAIRFASAAGALCASQPGALPSLPRRDDILHLLESIS